MPSLYTIKLVHRHAGRRNDTVLDTFVPDEAGGWTPVPGSTRTRGLTGAAPTAATRSHWKAGALLPDGCSLGRL